MKVLVLYSEIAGYFLAGIRSFVETYGAEVEIFRWPVHKDAPFRFTEIPGVTFHERKEMSDAELMEACKKINPDLVYVTGWIDKFYLKVAKHFYKQGVPTVCAFDNQWAGNMRQRVAAMMSPFFLKDRFNYVWVPGIFQFEYARRMGFAREQIRTGVYSAETENFEKIADKRANEGIALPKKLLYVGRFVEVKGLQELVPAFQSLRKEGFDWELQLVGEGEMKKEFEGMEGISVRGFVQPDELPNLALEAGAFILPSRFEPWGVVLHEFAAAGLPVIASDACGSATAFLRDGYNGFLHKAGDRASLRAALKNMMQASDEARAEMGNRSRELARWLTPQTWAATLHGFLPEK